MAGPYHRQRRRGYSAFAFCALVSIDLACSDPSPEESAAPQRDCPKLLWAKSSTPGAQLRVIGSWDEWREPGLAMTPAPDGWHTARVDVPEGEYGYLVVDGGEKRVDGYNPLTTFRGEDEVSLLLVPRCELPEIRLEGVDIRPESSSISPLTSGVTIRATFLRGQSGSPLAPSSIAVVPAKPGLAVDESNRTEARVIEADARSGVITVALSGAPRGNNVVRIQAADAEGHRAEQSVSAWIDPLAKQWNDSVIYQIMVDRFRASDGSPLAPPPSPAHRAGGTLDGVTAEVEKGTFERLGVSALWLSPPTTSPDEARIGRSGRLEEGYHGYWQLESRKVDPRLGGDEALDRLVAAVHRRGLRILIDIVPNHLYEKNPRYLLHRDQGWFGDGPEKCVCGEPDCLWSTHLETCWFTDFLPDYRHQNSDVTRETADDAAFWVRRYHVDGVRIDAVPMMPRAATRRLIHHLRGATAPASATFALGEIYAGTDLEAIRYYVGPAGLSSAFDFPFMWTVRDAVATGRAGFDDVDAVLAHTERALDGSGAILARILDNHDTSRFLSEANPEAGGDPWTDPAAQPSTPEPYRRLELGLVLLFTLPGIPVLYYGDEIGLAGRSDPDSRRVLPAPASLSTHQKAVLALTERLGSLRSSSEALRSGTRKSWVVAKDSYVFTRQVAGAQPVLVALSKSTAPTTVFIPAAALPAGRYVDAFSDETFVLQDGQGLSLSMAPLVFRILVDEGGRGTL